jgi:hypothetical protein
LIISAVILAGEARDGAPLAFGRPADTGLAQPGGLIRRRS